MLERIMTFDVNRASRWDVGAALTRPITNPFLKFAAGWVVGIFVCGLGGMLFGISLSDRSIRLGGVLFGLVFAMMPNPPSARSEASTIKEEHTND